MATEHELRAARAANAESALGTDRAAWFPNRLRPTSEQRAQRAEFVISAADREAVAGWKTEEELDGSEPLVPLYGRIVAKRGPFVVIQTPHGRAQAYFSKQAQGSDGLRDRIRSADLGDHVYVEGRPIRTRTGDAALSCRVFRHVAKALLPPPEKWHGLKDVEKRYRERYVDLFANPEVGEVFRARSCLVRALRSFLDERDYLEVETPLLHTVRGGATARPFLTHHNALDLSLFLRIAPELFLKRLLVGGFDRVYELGRNFRNEGISTRHNPEFTMLECYTAYATYEDLMRLVSDLISAGDQAVREQFPRLTEERSWSLDDGCQTVPMRQSIVERLARAGRDGIESSPWSEVLNAEVLDDAERLEATCSDQLERLPPVERKQLAACHSHGERIFSLYELLVEPHLTALYRTPDGSRSRPVFVTDFPSEVSPLSRPRDDDPRFAERFELYVDGRELLNAFSELNDPLEQSERFRAQVENRGRGDDEAMDYDEDYIRALSYGMPPAAGFGLGIDRFVMLLCSQASIRDVLLFPTLRPEAG